MNLPARDFRFEVAETLGNMRGQPLSKAVTTKLLQKESLRNVDHVLASPMFQGTVDPLQLKQQIADKQQQQQPAAA